MSNEAQLPAEPKRSTNPSEKPSGQARSRIKAKDAATSETVVSPRTSVSSVPEIPVAQGGPSRRASAVRLGLLTTSLALLIGGLAWFSDVPEISDSEPVRWTLGSSSTSSSTPDPLSPHVRHSLEQELRLAAMALDIRESQESLTRLWEDARSIASSIEGLATGLETIKSDVGAVRADAIAGLAQVDERLDHIEVAAVSEAIPLGDPALREATLLGDPELALRVPRYADINDELPNPRIADASELQAPTTGALPETGAAPQASVKVSFAKPKPRAPKPISGWSVHKVEDDLALVQGRDGTHYEVKEGELLPDAGIVRAIKKRGERWVVLTNKGLITEGK